jgi:hypothetical protein
MPCGGVLPLTFLGDNTVALNVSRRTFETQWFLIVVGTAGDDLCDCFWACSEEAHLGPQ